MSGPQISYCITPWVDCKQKYDKHVIFAQFDRCDAAICFCSSFKFKVCVTSLYDRPLELFLTELGSRKNMGEVGGDQSPCEVFQYYTNCKKHLVSPLFTGTPALLILRSSISRFSFELRLPSKSEDPKYLLPFRIFFQLCIMFLFPSFGSSLVYLSP